MKTKSSLAERRTPLTDAWVARLASVVSPKHGGIYGAQSELARHLCSLYGNTTPDHNDLTRWVSQFARWFNRTGLPGLEDYLRIEEWLRQGGTPEAAARGTKGRPENGRAKKPANSRRRQDRPGS